MTKSRLPEPPIECSEVLSLDEETCWDCCAGLEEKCYFVEKIVFTWIPTMIRPWRPSRNVDCLLPFIYLYRKCKCVQNADNAYQYEVLMSSHIVIEKNKQSVYDAGWLIIVSEDPEPERERAKKEREPLLYIILHEHRRRTNEKIRRGKESHLL